jgi:hypothetical protein
MDIEEGAQELNVKVHKAEEPTKQNSTFRL